MKQEEKAKAYDEALEKAKTCYQGGLTCLEDIFPELKESEDEKIKKVVKDFVENYLFWEKNNLTKEKALAWLEKQGTQEYHCTGVGEPKEETGVLKQLIDEEKSAWSKEDERAIGIIKIALEHPYDMEGKWDRKFALDWLKSLKDRVFPQLKQEWSEEDEYTLGETIQHLEELIRIDKAKHCSVDVQYYQRDIEWLKSLKERHTWKPSDEQMKLLKELVEDNNQRYFYTTLRSLYEQLKSLKGE